VTALCTTKNVDLVRSLGADVVVDYTREVHTTNGEAYDVLFDAVGKSEFEACKGSLAPGGLFITTDLGARWKNPRLVLWTAVFGSHRVLIPIPTYTKNDVLFLKELIGGRALPSGHRPQVPAGAGRRGHDLRRVGAEDGQRRPHRHP
jgi:NADPH:quinone reductase-like Zn-dependent oxidoreductase